MSLLALQSTSPVWASEPHSQKGWSPFSAKMGSSPLSTLVRATSMPLPAPPIPSVYAYWGPLPGPGIPVGPSVPASGSGLPRLIWPPPAPVLTALVMAAVLWARCWDWSQFWYCCCCCWLTVAGTGSALPTLGCITLLCAVSGERTVVPWRGICDGEGARPLMPDSSRLRITCAWAREGWCGLSVIAARKNDKVRLVHGMAFVRCKCILTFAKRGA